ncbi:MAG: hypothetical protein HC915_04235 [Anaerolineae bacterium]|nr:hypothetical protein [Anaerolineae bacterium]
MATIIPRFKLIMKYDVVSAKQAEYSHFLLGELVPGLQSLELYVTGVYQTVYGDYPVRQAEFVTESLEIMQNALHSERYEELERRLLDYTTNYSRKVVKYRSGFQF